MAAYFFDSSALVKRYVSESGSPWVVDITQPESNDSIHLVRITGAEIVSAITRVGRGGHISTEEMAVAIWDFHYDFDSQYRIIEVTAELIDQAMIIAEDYALRGYDAVQLAGVLTVNRQRLSIGLSSVTLVSADAALNEAATAEGLTVEDPNLHP